MESIIMKKVTRKLKLGKYFVFLLAQAHKRVVAK